MNRKDQAVEVAESKEDMKVMDTTVGLSLEVA